MLPIYETDKYLAPYANILANRRRKTIARLEDIKTTCGPLDEFATAYK